MPVDLVKIAELAVPALIAVAGWFIGGHLTYRFEKKRELEKERYEYLTKVYYLLSRARSQNFKDNNEASSILMDAQAEISVLGDKEHISQFNEIFKELDGVMTPNFCKDSDKLEKVIKTLRDDIRAHLKLSKIKEGVPHISRKR